MAKIKDLFSNRALEDITMSAINTLTFKKVNFAVGVFQGVALILHQVKYHFLSSVMLEFVGSDEMQVGLTVSDRVDDLVMDSIEVIDSHELVAVEHGVPANATLYKTPIVSDFTGLPGGGMLLPANPIFLAMMTLGFAAVGRAQVELIFTFKELSDKDYIELMQSRIQANI